jgi:hypothetical protein
MAWLGKARIGTEWLRKATLGKRRQVVARQCKTWLGNARRG